MLQLNSPEVEEAITTIFTSEIQLKRVRKGKILAISRN